MINNSLLKALIEALDNPEFDCPKNADDDGCWKKCIKEALLELKERRESDLRPATKFLSCGIGKQLSKIQQEFKEVESELAYERFNKENAAEELVDLQIACETMLAMLKLNETARADVRRRVIAKNKARGYYDE